MWSNESFGKANALTAGDIINFVRRRCAENGLEYPGDIGKTEERIRHACTHEALLRGC
jgi:hypothetical protein